MYVGAKKLKQGGGGMVGGTFVKGDKITSGYITPAFLGPHKWVELLQNPCVLGVPNRGGQNQKQLHSPCLGKEDS